jgi:hypothetical protein
MPNDDSDEFAAERLHPKGAYWRCRPEPDFRWHDWFARERPLEHDPLTPLVDVLQALQR